MKPAIKFGDILTYSDEWYRTGNNEKPKKPILFVASGKIVKEVPGEYLIYVVRENRSSTQLYHHSFLQKVIIHNQ